MGTDQPRSAGVAAFADSSAKITCDDQDYLVVPEIKGTTRINNRHPDCTYCVVTNANCNQVARIVDCSNPAPANNPDRGRVIVIHTDNASIEAYLVARVTEKLNGNA